MNAVLVPDNKGSRSKTAQGSVLQTSETANSTPSVVSSVSETEQPERQTPIGFGAAQARVLPLAMVAVFALSTVGLYLYQGDLAGSVGLGMYLAMWLGGGFGFLGGGILWAIGEMEADGAH